MLHYETRGYSRGRSYDVFLQVNSWPAFDRNPQLLRHEHRAHVEQPVVESLRIETLLEVHVEGENEAGQSVPHLVISQSFAHAVVRA